jgi:rhodanese-related sulfurtransferase
MISSKSGRIALVLGLSLISLTACFNGGSKTETTPSSTASVTGIQNVSNTELQGLLDKGVTLIDIRTPSEWQETGIIAGSKPITLFAENGAIAPDFVSKLQQTVSVDKPVALICRSGNRTQAGTQMLQQLGYKQIYNVTHGIKNWIAEGRNVTRF